MFSDVVFEQIIKKKFEGKDILKCLLYVLACTVGPTAIIYLLYWFLGEGVFAAFSFFILLYIAGIAIAIGLVRNTSIEYEYIFVNGELTIDKIIAKAKRKRMLTVDVKTIEKMGTYKPGMFADSKDATVVVYSDTYAGEGDLYMDFRHPTIGRTVVVVKTSERFEKALKTYVKRSIYNEAFPNG